MHTQENTTEYSPYRIQKQKFSTTKVQTEFKITLKTYAAQPNWFHTKNANLIEHEHINKCGIPA